MSRRDLRMRLPTTRPGPGPDPRLRCAVPMRSDVRLPEGLSIDACGAALTYQELDSLGWCLAAGTLTYVAYQDALALVLQRQFQCATVALWRVNGAPGERTLHSLGRYGANGARLPVSAALPETQLGLYFDVLNARGAYACDDALNDLNVDPLGVRHLRRDAPRAFLDALVSINGHALGVLSCCHDVRPRRWHLHEETTLKRVGARVALHLTRGNPPTIDFACSESGDGNPA